MHDPMLLTPTVFASVIVSGWLLGRARPKLNLVWLALTLFAAVTAHSGMQSAFVDGRLDQVLGDPRDGNHAIVVLIAAGEAVGLWLPFLLTPWAQFGARLGAALYALAAAALAASWFYFPFDLVIVNEEMISPFGPPYLLAAFACLPVAGVGYLIGWLKSVNARAEVEP